MHVEFRYKLKPYIILLADIGLQKVPAAVSLSVLQRKLRREKKPDQNERPDTIKV